MKRSLSNAMSITALFCATSLVMGLYPANASTDVSQSSSTNMSTLSGVTPSPPTNLSLIEKTSNSITFSWTAPTDDGGQPITDYLIEYSADNGSTWTTFEDGVSTESSSTITSLASGGTYQVRVSAVNAIGTGLPSAHMVPSINQVSARSNHTCAVLEDKTIKCWGQNNWGKFGNGTPTDQLTPVLASGITTATSVSGSGYNTCAVLEDKTIKCSGANGFGNLGDGTRLSGRYTPGLVSGITTAVSVSVDEINSCALLENKTIKCWGYNNFGQLGDGTTTQRTTPVLVYGITTAVSVSASGSHTCALLENKTIKCWGYNNFGQLGDGTTSQRFTPVLVSGIANAVSVSAGNTHTCAVLEDKTIKCWGQNNWGKLGDGTTNDQLTPVLVSGITTAVSVSGSEYNTCAVLEDKTIKCWGHNASGQLGDGTTTFRSTPVLVSGITTAVSVSTGEQHTCSMLEDKTIKCWGANAYGQLGDGTTTNRLRPTLVVVDSAGSTGPAAPTALTTSNLNSNSVTLNWVAPFDNGGLAITDYKIEVSSNSGATWSVITDGTSTATTYNVTGLTRATSYQFRVSAINIVGTSSTSNDVSVNTLTSPLPLAPTDVTLNSKASNSITFSWTAPTDNGGEPITDYLIEYSANNGSTWTTFEDGVSTVTSSTITSLASVGTYQVRVSAVNVIGTGSSSLLSAPTALIGNSISIGLRHTCALHSRQTIYCQGFNFYGQLGDGTTTNRLTPVLVSGITTAVSVSASGYHTCAVLEDKTIKCWGDNNSGGLGDGTTTNRLTPVLVSGITTAVSVSASGSHTCALLENRTIKCWGSNRYGQLGDGTNINRFNPVLVSGISNAVSVSVGYDHTCALLEDKTIKCWGYNYYGQLGDGTNTNRLTPVLVSGIANAVSASSGGYGYTCALLEDENIKCWGSNTKGELGDGTKTSRTTPVLVPGISNAVSVSAGGSRTCALLEDKTIKCWGDNQYGGLGGGFTGSGGLTPVLVSGITTAGSISSGGYGHTCALLEDKTVKCWGFNDSGQLGDGTTTTRLTPVPAFVDSINVQLPSVPPTSLSTTNLTFDSVTLNWVAPVDNGGSAITDYKIEVSANSGSTWSQITRSPSTAISYIVTGLTKGTNYQFRVSAINIIGTSSISNVATATTLTTVPGSPTSLTASNPTFSTVSLNWVAPIDDGGSALTDYVVEYRLVGTESWSTFNDGTSTATSAAVTELTKGSNYEFRVTAVNSQGNGAASSSLSRISAVKPLAPTNIVATERTINSVAISWDAPSDDGGRAITGYVVQRSTNLSSWTEVTTLASDVRAFRNEALTSNIVYYYRVAALSPEAVNATTAVFSSPSLGARTSILPFAPINLAASIQSGTSVSLAWASGGNPGAPVTDYVIERSDDSGQTWTSINDGSDTYLGKTITGLTQGAAYLFRVSAVNIEGTGPPTTLSSTIVPATIPSVASAPTVISQSNTAIGISWEAPYNGGRGITSYTVQVSGNAGATWATAANLTRTSVTALEATVGGLTQGSTYQFRISATNAMGTSGFSLASSPAKAATAPGPVSNFRQTANENNSITVSWASAFSNGSDLTKYEVDYSRNGVDWTTVETAGNANTIRIAGLMASAAYELRIRAVNLQGVGAYVQTEGATRGTTAQSISVFAANGVPVTGGSITWALNDGRARSSIGLPLNSSGLARFSLVATGLATVTIDDGLLSSGATVDGTWQVTFGFGSIELVLPDEPILTTKTLGISMPNGVKVPDAFVSTLSGFRASTYVSGFSFYAPSPGISAYTDKEGVGTLIGYSTGDPVAVITYDDSVLFQTIDVILSEQNTEVELPLMPWVTAPEVNKSIVAGEADTVLFTANAVPEVEVMTLGATDELNPEVTASSVSTLAFEPGVRVTVVPPVGAESSPYGCTQVLSALTDANGVATLKICPSVSGEYKVVTAGAVASKPLIYNVLGRPAPAIIPAAPSQNIAPAPAPAAAPVPAAPAAPAQPTMLIKQRTAGASLATQIGMTVTPKAKVKLTVAKTSKKICKVSGGKLVALKPGNCSVTVSVTPKKTKLLKKPKTSKRSTVVRIS